MSYEGLGSLVAEILQASKNIAEGDAHQQAHDELATSINELFSNAHRPGAAWERKNDDIDERKDAVGLCHNRRALTVPKIDRNVSDNYTPSNSEIDEALTHRKAMKALLVTAIRPGSNRRSRNR